jgi:hypothetical protein
MRGEVTVKRELVEVIDREGRGCEGGSKWMKEIAQEKKREAEQDLGKVEIKEDKREVGRGKGRGRDLYFLLPAGRECGLGQPWRVRGSYE